MLINKDVLKSLKPCENRYRNFLMHYPDFSGSFDEFLDLTEITYEDKVWVAKHILNKNQLVHFGILCAESVLNIFESKYPNDKRVRDCINFLKDFPSYESLTDHQREAILEKRREAKQAYDSAAYAAASDAAYAAYAAYAAASDAASAADAYAYAYAAYAAYAAAYAAAKLEQQKLNIQFLKMAASL